MSARGAAQERTNITASTIMQFGDDALKRTIIPKFLTEDTQQCLLYSEPGAGSDLVVVRTRAERVGDKYVVDRQKVWTSGAHREVRAVARAHRLGRAQA